MSRPWLGNFVTHETQGAKALGIGMPRDRGLGLPSPHGRGVELDSRKASPSATAERKPWRAKIKPRAPPRLKKRTKPLLQARETASFAHPPASPWAKPLAGRRYLATLSQEKIMSPSIASRQAPGRPMTRAPRSHLGAFLRPQTTPPSHPVGRASPGVPRQAGSGASLLRELQSALFSLRSDPGALSCEALGGVRISPRRVRTRPWASVGMGPRF